MLLEAFLDYLRLERNVSVRTLEEYRDDLMAFESFYKELDSDLAWQTIDTDIVREWVVAMMEKGNKATSIQRRLSALRSCYRFLYKRGLVEHDPVHNLTAPKKERVLPAFVREEDMDRLLDMNGMFDDNFEGRRDHLIVAMLYETGLRLSELIGLNLDDVSLAAQTLKVLGKGNKERIVPFGAELLHLINIYIRERGVYATNEADKDLLPDRKGEAPAGILGSLHGESKARPRDGTAQAKPARAETHLRHLDAQPRSKSRIREGTAGARKALHHGDLHPHHVRGA